MNMITDLSIKTTYERQAQIFKTLAHPARIAILEILREGEHCVCHMEAHLGYRQAYLSQQLAVLRDAGLVTDRRDGWNIYYRVISPDIYAVLDAVQKISGKSPHSRHNPNAVCACPHCSEVVKTG